MKTIANTLFPMVLLLLSGCEQGAPASAAPTPAPTPAATRSPAAAPAATAPGAFVPHPDVELTLSEPSRRYLLERARVACSGNGAAAAPAPPGLEAKRSVMVVAYRKSGGRVAMQQRQEPGATLVTNVEAAARAACHGKDADDLFLHVAVQSYLARFPNFGIKGLFEYKVFEPQITGIVYTLGGKRVELDPLRQAELNYGPKNTREHLAKSFGETASSMNSRNDLTIEMYRVIHFGERFPDRQFTDFHRGLVRLEAEQLTTALLKDRIKLIGDWYRNNVIDGEVTYKYAPSPRTYRNKERTMVRSTMAVWVLNRLARYLGDAELNALGRETIDFYLKRYFQIEKSRAAGEIVASTVPLPNGNLVKNRYTTASFIASALLERADWKESERDVELLMQYAMGFQRNDGVMHSQFAQSQYFMPGQLLLAVSYAFKATADPRYKQYFERTWDTYETPIRQMMYFGNEIYFPLAPAWYTQPLASMYAQTGEARYRDTVFEINDRVARIYTHNANWQVYYDYDGIMTPKLGYYGNNSVTAAALESIADAAITAKASGDAVRLAEYKRVVRRVTAYLLRLQLVPANTYYMRHRERVVGGFKTDLVNNHVWMDNVWHLTSAFMKIADAGLLD